MTITIRDLKPLKLKGAIMIELSKQAKKDLKKLKIELNLMPKRELIELVIKQIDDQAKILTEASRVINQLKSERNENV